MPLTTHGVIEYIEDLASEIKEYLDDIVGDVDVLVWPDVVKPSMKCFSWDRVQYHAGCILKNLRDLFQAMGILDSSLVIGIGYLDGFEYGLNFVFGEAQPGNHVAIVFTKRLRTSFHGDRANYNLYFERLVKETLHELGHLLSLEHCNNYCVMRFSNSVYDVDEKPRYYCDSCKAIIRQSYISRTK